LRVKVENRPKTTPRFAPELPEELAMSTTFLLKRLAYAAKERTMKAYEEIGLHPYHYAILLVLDDGSHETQGSIADALGYDRGQLVGLLDELEEHGLVERRRDPDDRRRHIVRMTPNGAKMLRRLRALARKNEDAFLEPLSDSQRADLLELLQRLAEKHEPRCAPLAPPATAELPS
jgi:MarR family transcriptional regulator, lower aerobic nicotinate degradation pathway regulator